MMILAALTGAVLGMRFRVLVLIPAIGLCIVLVAAFGAVRGMGLAHTATMVIASEAALQLSYLVGALLRFAIAGTRLSGSASFAPKHNPREEIAQ